MKTFWRSPFLTLIILVFDSLALASIWSGVYQLRFALNSIFVRHLSIHINPAEPYMKALPMLLAFWLAILARQGFYSHHERIASLNRLAPILWAAGWMIVVVAIYNAIFKPDFGRTVVGGFAAGSALYLYLSRTLFRIAKRAAVERGHGRVRALVVGAGELGNETMSRVHEHPDIGFRVVGFVAADPEDERKEIEGHPVLGRMSDLVPIVQRYRVEEVFLAVPDMKEDDIFQWVCDLQSRVSVVCKVVANMLYVIVNRAKVDEIIGMPVIAFRNAEMYPAQLFVKRIADLAIGGGLALLISPVALLFAVLIKLDSPGPVLFSHERTGWRGRRFRLVKFRTMKGSADPYCEAPVDQNDGRITRFGRFLRRTSLDEIPQFLNVLKGEMSLVGPRPEMPFIVESYSGWQKVRLQVKPGLSGLWQVAGRKNLPLHHNLEYDFYYVKNQSLALDAEIALRTIPAVVLGKGAY
ncbi:sugar transferase [Candidatus Sumerlaeota bacterium]|nr:sugar transferase [Candidatus Sumerlaeota bacterium]